MHPLHLVDIPPHCPIGRDSPLVPGVLSPSREGEEKKKNSKLWKQARRLERRQGALFACMPRARVQNDWSETLQRGVLFSEMPHRSKASQKTNQDSS